MNEHSGDNHYHTPPRPPPHTHKKSSALPDGNYDIFIIPPHSAGSGFLYLPSLKPNTNSFIAGFLSALIIVIVYNILTPTLYKLFALLNSGIGILLLLLSSAAIFHVYHTSPFLASSRPYFNNDHNTPKPTASSSSSSYTYQTHNNPAPPRSTFTSTPSSPESPWDKARAETRRREASRAQAAAATAAKEASERLAKEAAEKNKWEQARAREKDIREREAREKIAKERAERTNTAKPSTQHYHPSSPVTGRKYEKPTAESVGGTDSDYHSQTQKDRSKHVYAESENMSESSYAPSGSTTRTTPPPSSHSNPTERYKTTDENKVVIKGVYMFTNKQKMPESMLVAGNAGVTDGLILRITTEGLFIDDDVRGVPQREWDVKAWGIKLVEVSLSSPLFRLLDDGFTDSFYYIDW